MSKRLVRLHEYQGKQVLKDAKIPVPSGKAAATPAEAKQIAEQIGKPVAVKAQIWATGRFAAGGIKFADTPAEAEKFAAQLLGSEIKNMKVEKVLVEERLDIAEEYYAGVIVDTSAAKRAPVVIFSSKGGSGVEEIVAKYPQNVARMTVDVIRGVRGYDGIQLAFDAGLRGEKLRTVSSVVSNLYEAFVKADARAAEINPLVMTKDGKICAADCRISVDDSAVFRHPEFEIKVPRESVRLPTELEAISWTIEEGDYRGNSYLGQMVDIPIREKGVIGYHGIGGGGAILGVDALQRQGLKNATYSDTSGNPTASKCYRIAKLILSIPNIEGYMLGGFIVANQEQWHHAHGIVKALREEVANRPGFPVLLLLCGNREKEAIQILKEGLTDLPVQLEIYGSDYVYKSDFLAGRMKAMIEEYRKRRP
ncbi:MAG: ATP-grasp domain-containing protein [archaeon]